MTFSLGGIGSGIDTNALVDGLMSVARLPLQQLDARKKDIDGASTTISGFSSRLSAVKTAALALTTSVGFSALAASSSDAAVVASVTGAANGASYSVAVSALARGQKSRSDLFAEGTTALGMSGTLTLKVGANGTPKDITVTSTDSMRDIADKITASGSRVTATIMNTGMGYRLMLQGQDSGEENAFTMTESGTTLGLDLPAAIYETAQDAAVTVDGIEVKSKTNQITGVIPGVTLALTKTTTAAATVSVSSDPAQLRTKIGALVTAYNALVTMGQKVTGFGETKPESRVLAGDRSIRESVSRLARLVGSAVPGASGRFTTLASVGLTLKRDGQMSFDSAKMDTALSTDPAGVARLFVTDTMNGSTGVMKSIMTAVDGLVTGSGSPVQARLDALSSQSKALASSRDKMVGRLEQYQTQLKKQFLEMDQAVSKYNAQGSQAANIAKINTRTG
jgi:flagellar hook-associated protein 2